jgi:hypothetical protein
MSEPVTAGTPGHRVLSDVEKYWIEAVRNHGEMLCSMLGDLAVDELKADKRWLAIARTHFQEGLMATVRAITKPEFF